MFLRFIRQTQQYVKPEFVRPL